MVGTSFTRASLAIALVILVCAPLASLADASRLSSGDVIQVTVDGEKEFSKPYQVNKQGCITMPMVDPVKVEGLNTTDSAAVITKALGKVLVNPQVTVAFLERERMRVFVVGQVQKTGMQEVGVGDRVIQALAQAGYDDTADLSHVNVRRGDQVIELDLTRYLSAQDLNANVELQSNDTVVVPKSESIGTVMVLGQATKTGPVAIRKGMTFREVLGLIGGVTVEADTDKITLKHRDASEAIPINYKRAMDGDPSADLALQVGDTVYVPQLETAFYTVMGGVNRPGQYPLKGRLTLSEAVGEAGGPQPHVGDMRKVQLMRASTDAKKKTGETLNVDLTDVMKQGSEEPLVRRGDVVYVAVHREKTNFLDIIRSVLPFGWIFK